MPKSQRILLDAPGVCVRLSYYGPGERMPSHEHAVHQVSWLMSGEMFEGVRSRECELFTAARGSKPAGCAHANIYGQQGALLLSVNLDADRVRDFLPDDADDWGWQPTELAPATALLGLIAGGGEAAQAAVADLLALEQSQARPETRTPPRWLMKVREQLRDAPEAPDLAALAAESGVHRVHLSRAFTRHFGLSPSVYRARSRGARAIASMIEGERLADAAIDAGFADQSHFTRFLKRETGVTPRRLQNWMLAS